MCVSDEGFTPRVAAPCGSNTTYSTCFSLGVCVMFVRDIRCVCVCVFPTMQDRTECCNPRRGLLVEGQGHRGQQQQSLGILSQHTPRVPDACLARAQTHTNKHTETKHMNVMIVCTNILTENKVVFIQSDDGGGRCILPAISVFWLCDSYCM